jgi:hypothetical protein
LRKATAACSRAASVQGQRSVPPRPLGASSCSCAALGPTAGPMIGNLQDVLMWRPRAGQWAVAFQPTMHCLLLCYWLRATCACVHRRSAAPRYTACLTRDALDCSRYISTISAVWTCVCSFAHFSMSTHPRQDNPSAAAAVASFQQPHGSSSQRIRFLALLRLDVPQKRDRAVRRSTRHNVPARVHERDPRPHIV